MPASWLDIAPDSPFGIATLPYGVFGTESTPAPRVGVAIGDHVLDVAATARALGSSLEGLLTGPTLNPLLAAGPAAWRDVRDAVTTWLTDATLADRVRPHLHDRASARLYLPFEVADYVDFYSCEHHAANVGRIFRPGQPPLTPNWRHLPIGYHGRAGTVVVSGTDVVRPSGQRKGPHDQSPLFGPSTRLDIEAEVGFVVGVPTEPGTRVRVADFADHVFGAFLLNDWSARDLQAWEYVPLGPFLGKSFATSVSPWVVPLAALAEARVAPPARDPEPLPYLRDVEDDPWGLDLRLEVRLNGHLVARPPFAQMYWTPAQQLAHLTVNGARLRTGDIYASGTVSGPERDQRGSLLELAWNGEEPLRLPDGGERSFLADGDRVSITATAPGPQGSVIGFGEVTGRILPARG
ncbi:fumarylacetoacetate hydrolase [Marinactinospora thermotolerans DSM 45154]|uniref:fumarylacetoacetase n=1 Tax=Marinactinospora thermotolerans DSM 45154 TaxID=1122192 RepID=A0A1T4K0Y1_9ACTN|nr:fumarylacetoacetase [Marinactinospora thermotolerans]SJZ36054.1 fumarylacetoacetate hydrolase [Marinactinospora thermotolerans DSM 45154]